MSIKKQCERLLGREVETIEKSSPGVYDCDGSLVDLRPGKKGVVEVVEPQAVPELCTEEIVEAPATIVMEAESDSADLSF